MDFEDRKVYKVKYFLTFGDNDDSCYLNMAVTAPDRECNMKDIKVSVNTNEFYGIGYDVYEDDWDDKYADQVKFETLSNLLYKEAMRNNIDPTCLKIIDCLE